MFLRTPGMKLDSIIPFFLSSSSLNLTILFLIIYVNKSEILPFS